MDRASVDRASLDRALRFIDSWLGFRVGRVDIPGCAVAVAFEGETLLDRAWGLADVERRTRLTPEHAFRVASHSKTFTAAAVMQLVERGALRLDDPAAQHLPWLGSHSDGRMRAITVRQLLSHSAGVIRDGVDADYWQLTRPFPDADGFRAELGRAALVLEPNITLKYSNFGYTILGLLVAEVAACPWAEYVVEHLIAPLGLSRTGPEPAAGGPALVTGYGRADIDRLRRPVAGPDTRSMGAATGFYSTASDLCAWFSALQVGSGRVLEDASKREMQRLQWPAVSPGRDERTGYGLGMHLEEVGTRQTYGHGGGFPGQITRSMADPADGLVVSVLTNCIDGPATTIARAVFEVVDWFAGHALSTPKAAESERLGGRLMNLWSVCEVVVAGDTVVAAQPDTWQPFVGAEELVRVDDTTCRIGRASSFSSPGELVRFDLVDGRVRSVDYAGMTMWPEAAWLAREAAR